MSEYTPSNPHPDAILAQAQGRAAAAAQRAQQLAEIDPALSKMAEYQRRLGEVTTSLADKALSLDGAIRLENEQRALERLINQHQPDYDAAFAAYCKLVAAAQEASAEVAYYRQRISVAEQQLAALAEEERAFLADLASRRAAVQLELDRCVGDPGSPALTAERRAREEKDPSRVAERRRQEGIASLRQQFSEAVRAQNSIEQMNAQRALDALGVVV
jgi:hypothetical protein